MLFLGNDILAIATTGNPVSGDSDSLNVIDKNPANPYTWTTASKVFNFVFTTHTPKTTLEYVSFPFNFVSLHGISESLMGATVLVEYITSAFNNNYEVASFDVGFDRHWTPFGGEGYSDDFALYYNTLLNASSYEDDLHTLRVTITMPSTGTYSVGEIAAGFMESPGLNYQYGRSLTQSKPLITNTTIGGIDWVYAQNAVIRNRLDFSWGPDIDLQDIEILRQVYRLSEYGLYPIIFVPDSSVRSGPNSCYYGRISSDQSDVEEFFNLYSKSIEFTESVAYEEPSE